MYSRRTGLFIRAAGLLLAGSGLAFALYGFRTASAQTAYYQLKFGSSSALDVAQKQALAEVAHRRYGHNYNLSMLLATESWDAQESGGGGVDAPRMTAAAATWCARGIAQNPYRRELRWQEALLAAVESPAHAVSLWRGYVEFAFWDGWNLGGLIWLMARAGQLEDAMELLPLLRGRSEYATALKTVAAAWRNESR